MFLTQKSSTKIESDLTNVGGKGISKVGSVGISGNCMSADDAITAPFANVTQRTRGKS